MSAPDIVELQHAAYGTLSNGSDVRLLASPADIELSADAKAAIETFFYTAWKAVTVRREPYFAFFKLDDEYWGLCQVRWLGRGAAGEVLVVWVAMLQEQAQLDRIDWRTHCLLQSAFPDPVTLPKTGTRLAPHRAELMKAEVPAVAAYNGAFDQLAYALTPEYRARLWRAHLVVEPPQDPQLEPLTAEGALFGLWERLGSWRSDISYCTWAGISNFGYQRDQGFFRLLISASEEPLPSNLDHRMSLNVGSAQSLETLKQPSTGWLMFREAAAGVAPTQSNYLRKPTLEDNDQMAQLLFEVLRGNLADAGSNDVWRHFPVAYPGALPGLMDRMVRELSRTDPIRAAEVVGRFAMEMLPDAKAIAARAAVRNRLTHRLPSAALAGLSESLFAGPESSSYIVEIEEALLAEQTSWRDWEPLLSAVMRQPDPRLVRLRDRLIALAWSQPPARAAASEAMAQLVLANGADAIIPILELKIGPPSVRAQFFAAFSGRLRARRRDWRLYARDRASQLRLLRLGRQLDAELCVVPL